MAKKKKNVSSKKVRKVVRRPSKGKTVSAPRGVGITPLHDRVVVRPLSETELGTTTASGIIIPETVDKERPERGTVVAVGAGRIVDGKLVKPSVSVGDIVVFSKYGYDEITVGGIDYVVLKEESILARVAKS